MMKHLLITTVIASAFAVGANANEMKKTGTNTEQGRAAAPFSSDTGTNSNIGVNSQGSGTAVKPNSSANGSSGQIANLPAKGGNVSLTGKVTSIDMVDNEFTLQDKTGATIDVESEQKLSVNEGDTVSVSGTINEDMGEKEVAASKITVTASNAGSSSDKEGESRSTY